jgi:predicted RNA-binding protein associated with RNAse of E/G family
MAVVVERRITSSGTYDALGVEREDGDIARTRFEEGGRAYATVYKSADGEKKGTYVNVCTPLEVFPDAVRYTDLYIDVVEVDGETRVVDEEELTDAVGEGVVTEGVAERAREVADRTEERL